MKRLFRFAVLLVFCAAWMACGPVRLARADKIFLKNGKVYEGKVVGKSDRRYLFVVKAAGEEMPLSFYIEEVDRVDMEKDSVERQIPYLKEVGGVTFNVGGSKKGYALDLYKKEQKGSFGASDWYSLAEIQEVLNKEEFAYYQQFGEITSRYAPKFIIVDTMYADLSQANTDDFELAKTYMHDLYYELSHLTVPPAFRTSHDTYLEAVRATSLSFDALEKGVLEEATRLTQVSQENRVSGMTLFRQVVQSRRPSPKKDEGAAPQAPEVAPEVAPEAVPETVPEAGAT